MKKESSYPIFSPPMKNIIDLFSIKNFDPPAVFLLISNILFLFIAIFSRITLFEILLVFYVQSCIIAFFAALRMLNAEGLIPSFSSRVRKAVIIFFGFLIFGTYPISLFSESGVLSLPTNYLAVLFSPLFLFSIAMFFFVHLISFIYDIQKRRFVWFVAKYTGGIFEFVKRPVLLYLFVFALFLIFNIFFALFLISLAWESIKEHEYKFAFVLAVVAVVFILGILFLAPEEKTFLIVILLLTSKSFVDLYTHLSEKKKLYAPAGI